MARTNPMYKRAQAYLDWWERKWETRSGDSEYRYTFHVKQDKEQIGKVRFQVKRRVWGLMLVFYFFGQEMFCADWENPLGREKLRVQERGSR